MSRYWFALLCLVLPLVGHAGARHQDLLSQLRMARSHEEAEAVLRRTLGVSEPDYERFFRELTLNELTSLSGSQKVALTRGPVLSRLMSKRVEAIEGEERVQWLKALGEAKLQMAKDALQAVAPYPSMTSWAPSASPAILGVLHRISTDVRSGQYSLDEPLAEHLSVALIRMIGILVREERHHALLYAANEHLRLFEAVRAQPEVSASLSVYSNLLPHYLNAAVERLERLRRTSYMRKLSSQEDLEYLSQQWSSALKFGPFRPLNLPQDCPYSAL